MKKLLIFPYNGNGLEAVNCISSEFELIGFIDDTPEKQGKQKNGFTVYSRDALQKFQDALVLAVPGSSTSFPQRQSIIDSLNINKDRWATIIHPKASVSPLADIGYNTLIMAGAVITSNAVIGNHVCILPNSVIHHDCKIDDYCLIGSNIVIAGHVIINKNCYIGSGSNLINDIEIGETSLIGLGTNVIGSIPANSKAVGNPAKIIGNVI